MMCSIIIESDYGIDYNIDLNIVANLIIRLNKFTDLEQFQSIKKWTLLWGSVSVIVAGHLLRVMS